MGRCRPRAPGRGVVPLRSVPPAVGFEQQTRARHRTIIPSNASGGSPWQPFWVTALAAQPGRRLQATTPGTGPTHGLKISGGFSNIFQRVAVFETFRRQNQPNDARLSAAHPKMSDLPPLVWSRIDATTLEPCPSQTKNAQRKTRPRPHAPFTCVARQACEQGHGPHRVWATLPCCRARSYR